MITAIRIVIADDHKVLRDGLRAIIQDRDGMVVVGDAENGREALRQVQKHKPDIVIMDISMPDLNGIEATRQIVAEMPEVKVIALSMHSDRLYVERMLRAGVSGYMLKECASEDLINCIHTVRRGKIYLSPEITTTVVKDYLEHPPGTGSPIKALLSARELEILQLIAEGRSTKDISSLLHISIKTVESHRKNIMEKLNLFTVAELTKFALREGLTTLDT